MKRVAVIGTGIMGAHLARRLTLAGFDVTAWNRDAAKAAALAPHGVRAARDLRAALEGADAAIVMLSTGPVVDPCYSMLAMLAMLATVAIQPRSPRCAKAPC